MKKTIPILMLIFASVSVAAAEEARPVQAFTDGTLRAPESFWEANAIDIAAELTADFLQPSDIGITVQEFDDILDSISNLTGASGSYIRFTGVSAVEVRTPQQIWSDLQVDPSGDVLVVEPTGTATDIDVEIAPKGSGTTMMKDGAGINAIAARQLINSFGDATLDWENRQLRTFSGVSASWDADDMAGNTRFLLYDVDTSSVQRIRVGPDDSGPGGSGRALYIDNIIP